MRFMSEFLSNFILFKNFSVEDNHQLDVSRSFSHHFKLGKPKKKFDCAEIAPQG